MIDENEFFREVTLRLCSHLEIEEGLRACIKYLSGHMPADIIYLERYEEDLAAMRGVARATVGEAERLDLLAPLSADAQAAMAEGMNDLPEVFLVNDPEEEPVTRCLLGVLGQVFGGNDFIGVDVVAVQKQDLAGEVFHMVS